MGRHDDQIDSLVFGAIDNSAVGLAGEDHFTKFHVGSVMGKGLGDKLCELHLVCVDLAIGDGIGFIEDNDIQDDDLSPDLIGQKAGIANPFARESEKSVGARIFFSMAITNLFPR